MHILNRRKRVVDLISLFIHRKIRKFLKHHSTGKLETEETTQFSQQFQQLRLFEEFL